MKLHAVLVRSEYPSNVGAAARALANMGGDRLILIDPRCDLNEERARQMAAGAQDMLAKAVVYPSWNEFYAREGEGVRIALTRRAGRARKVFPLGEKIAELKAEPPGNLYLIFGPEADGLDAEDISLVNFCCHLPVYGEFASLNLAQAVLLALFQVRQQIEPALMPKQVTGEEDRPVQPLYFPDQLIRDWLTAMGFDIQARRSSAYLTLKRLFMANQPTRHEYQVLEAILQQNVRKLRELNPLCGGTTDSQPE
jgi:tRNA/rRNA methyltransferase